VETLTTKASRTRDKPLEQQQEMRDCGIFVGKGGMNAADLPEL
jgi:Ulp1 family protease